MALIEFRCASCGELFERFLDAGRERGEIFCPKCGKAAEQNFSGKCYGAIGKSGGCSGNCKTCSGCKHG